MRKRQFRILAALTALVIASVSLAGCDASLAQIEQALEAMEEAQALAANTAGTDASVQDPSAKTEDEQADEPKPDKDIYIIYTNDVHCGVDQGFGYAGVWQIRKTLEEEGYETILVDDGDFIQGEAIGTLSKGESVISIMNAMDYDVVTPGNHEFDYGMDEFLKITNMVEFPIISCNFTKDGKTMFDPYLIKDTAGLKIAFVGVTTPESLIKVSIKNFCDENGNLVYGFMQGDGTQLYKAVQDAVDSARAEGADLVYVLGHIGNAPNSKPYSCMDIIANTNGIDVFIDGHTHDTDQMMLPNKDGKEIPRTSAGTKLECVGYSHISAEDGSIDTGIWTWTNKTSIPDMLGIHNEESDVVDRELSAIEETIKQVVAKTDVDLEINDPNTLDDNGEPVRIVRKQETNLGDLCADAARIQTGADIGIVNAGGVRAAIPKGDITYGDIIDVHPFSNPTSIIEVTGQQMLDALEWSCRKLPDENGGLFQVSGMSYEVDISIPSGCKQDETGVMSGIEGMRRVSNVKVDGKPIDPEGKYTVAGNAYTLCQNGDGNKGFDGATVNAADVGVDSQLLIDYIVETLGGTVAEEYDDPYGQGRIVIHE